MKYALKAIEQENKWQLYWSNDSFQKKISFIYNILDNGTG